MSDTMGSLGADKNKPAVENPPIYLLEVDVPTSPPTCIRLTNNTEDIAHGINPETGEVLVYRHAPFNCDGVGQNKKADLESLSIRIEKPRPVLLEEIIDNDWLLDQRFVLTWLQAAPPFNPAGRGTFEGFVVGAKIEGADIVFTIGNPGLSDAPFPTRRYSGQYCGVDRFGDERCGYKLIAGATNVIGGGFDFCGYHLTDCDIRGQDEAARAVEVLHPLNFDCVPGVLRGNSP